MESSSISQIRKNRKYRRLSFISSEVEEMLRTCSKMGILRDGRKVGELSGNELSQDGIMKAIAGGDSNE